MTFTGMLCTFIFKEHLPRTQETLEHACLEHNCDRSLKLCNWSSNSSKFVFIDRRSWNIECPGLWHAFGILLAS